MLKKILLIIILFFNFCFSKVKSDYITMLEQQREALLKENEELRIQIQEKEENIHELKEIFNENAEKIKDLEHQIKKAQQEEQNEFNKFKATQEQLNNQIQDELNDAPILDDALRAQQIHREYLKKRNKQYKMQQRDLNSTKIKARYLGLVSIVLTLATSLIIMKYLSSSQCNI